MSETGNRMTREEAQAEVNRFNARVAEHGGPVRLEARNDEWTWGWSGNAAEWFPVDVSAAASEVGPWTVTAATVDGRRTATAKEPRLADALEAVSDMFESYAESTRPKSASIDDDCDD